MRRKVLHILYSLYHGGAERIVETVIRFSPRDRYEHHVCSLTGEGDLAGAMRSSGAGVFLMNKRRRGDVALLPRLGKLIERERIDILHLHNSPAALYGTLAAMLRVLRLPIVRTEHRPYIPEDLPAAYRALYPFITRRAARVICVADMVRESFASRFPALTDRYVTIHNGIDTVPFDSIPPREECRARFKLPRQARIVGTIGRLVPIKNHTDLIEAAFLLHANMPDLHIAILGDGPLRDRLSALAVDKGIPDLVSILPATGEVPDFLGALDIFALPSDSEGLPLTLLEALAAGLPTVATRVGGIPEVIADGENGLLVTKGSPRELASSITGLLLDPGRAEALAAAGRETIRERFSAAGMVAGIENLYDEL